MRADQAVPVRTSRTTSSRHATSLHYHGNRSAEQRAGSSGPPGDLEAVFLWSGPTITPPVYLFYHATQPAVSVVLTSADCRQQVLEADLIGDEEECALRDHLLAFHPQTLQPKKRNMLLGHFVLTEP